MHILHKRTGSPNVDAFKVVEEINGLAPVYEGSMLVCRAKYSLRILERDTRDEFGPNRTTSTHYDLNVEWGGVKFNSLQRYTLCTPSGKIDFFRLDREIIPMGGLYR